MTLTKTPNFTVTAVTLALDPATTDLAQMTGAKYLIVERATGRVLNLNNFGQATRWSYNQPSSALHNTHLANTQIRPAVLYDVRARQAYVVVSTFQSRRAQEAK